MTRLLAIWMVAVVAMAHAATGEDSVMKGLAAKDIEGKERSLDMFAKVKVAGPEKHALYERLTGKSSPFPGEVTWNFTKFLLDKNGKVMKRFAPDVEPDAEEIVKAVETALAGK
ncbi:MAG: glutathione peroxidase [Verrucomicrobia bacterium]|nr:glutathione peroxidase [Verrucomicrobiota bacterium]